MSQEFTKQVSGTTWVLVFDGSPGKPFRLNERRGEEPERFCHFALESQAEPGAFVALVGNGPNDGDFAVYQHAKADGVLLELFGQLYPDGHAQHIKNLV